MDIASSKNQQSLTNKSIAALKWNYLGRVVSMSLQLGIGIVLARLLGPEPFGLVAIALFIQSLGNLFAEGGLGAALIQSQDISEHDIRSVFSIQMLIGIGITSIVAGLAPLLAGFFKEPNAAPVIMIMASSFTVQALGQTANALIRRNLEFKKVQIISLISYCIGYMGFGLPMAYLDYGVWSLVAAQLTQVSINALGSYFSHMHPILPLVAPKHCRFLKFGAAITFNNITSWAISNLDTAIVGRFFETAILGVYNRVFNLVNMPMYAVTSSLQSVLFSAYSRAQSNRLMLRHIFVASVNLMALLFLPVYSAMAAAPELVILGIYGDSWQAAIPLMSPLCLAMAVNAMLAMAGPLLTAIGLPQIELKAQILALLFGVPALLIAAQYSPETLAWTVLGSYVLRYGLLVGMALIALNSRRRQIVGIALVPALIATILYIGVTVLKASIARYELSMLNQLALVVTGCAITYPLLLIGFRGWIICGSFKKLIQKQQHRIPARFYRLTGLPA